MVEKKDFCRLFREMVECQKLDLNVAEMLLQRILKILFPESKKKPPKIV